MWIFNEVCHLFNYTFSERNTTSQSSYWARDQNVQQMKNPL